MPKTLFVLAIAFSLLSSLSYSSVAQEPGDPLRPEQYGLDQLQMDGAYQDSTGKDTVIAVLDTGVDLNHPDLVSKIVPGWDFVDNDDQPQDLNGHGTHVAGIAAAITNNGVGIAGAAPNAKIMPVRVLNAIGSGNVDTIARAILWASDNGADVINLSLGGDTSLLSRIFQSGPMNEAIVAADANGTVVIAAAGNDDAFIQAYEAETPVLIVNASNQAGQPAQFTNWGDPRAVAAPGVQILSTSPTGPSLIWPEGTTGYSVLDGTSMATPFVAGIAALLVDTRRGESPEAIRNFILDSAENPNNDPRLGAGIVNAQEAVSRSDGSNGQLIAAIFMLVIIVVSLLAFVLAIIQLRKRSVPQAQMSY